MTTTPVASGGLGELTDEDDDGLLIGGPSIANINQSLIPCSGIHSTAPLFAHSNCAHSLDVHGTNQCATTLSGVLITDPTSIYNQSSQDDFNIQVPCATSFANQINNNNFTLASVTATNKNNTSDDQKLLNSSLNQIKKQVQFQSVHPQSNQTYFAQFTQNPELLQRTSSPATFVLPVSMAAPQLGDIYCHGTAIAYNTNYSSIDSTTSYNSTSCASCCNYQMHGSTINAHHCPSLPGEKTIHFSILINFCMII